METLSLASLKKALPDRPKNAHKGMFGHVCIVGGDYGMAGASLLAGEAALRCGAGSVTVATRPEHAENIFTAVPELMSVAVTKPEECESILHHATVILLGPGLGQKEWGRSLFEYVMNSPFAELPMVVDADALNLLSSFSTHKMKDNWILTPHPGEAARLLGCSVESLQNDRPRSIDALQKQYGGVVVLKGANTLILDNLGNLKRCDFGNPGMASPGMGDVLAGLIAGLLAQKLAPMDAASLAVVLHAIVGDKAAEFQGERGILASDLLGYIPECLNL